ncbi:MAG: AzlC family ABC transporter permease [Halothermotrichaceae bacterium]
MTKMDKTKDIVIDKKTIIYDGIKASIPVIMGYLPIGIAYGLLATKAGLSGLTTVLMSVFVFAGSSQLIAVNMISAGTGIIPIVIMTFLVNLRHILMSASLSLHFSNTDRKLLPLLGFVITDESFAVGSVKFKNYSRKDLFYLTLGVSNYFGWVFSSWLGVIIGNFLNKTTFPGIDFVLPAMFIVLLVMQIQRRLDVFIAIISAALSLSFVFILPENWNIIAATVIAATMGVFFERWK